MPYKNGCISWNKGIHLSEEHKKNIKQAHLQRKEKLGYVNSFQVRGKISKTLKEKFKNPESHPMFGKHHTETTKRKMREKRFLRKREVGYLNSQKTREKMRKSSEGRCGAKASNWKGGISRAYKTGYYSKKYKDWRRTVFIRDEFTCRECGQKHIYITAHHIKPFAKYPELRFEVSNGLTVCEECHCKLDKYRARFRKKNV